VIASFHAEGRGLEIFSRVMGRGMKNILVKRVGSEKIF
jgi:hypothetical protein